MNIFEGLISSYKDAGAYTSRAIAKMLSSLIAFHIAIAGVFLLYFMGSLGPDISPMTPLVLYPIVYHVAFNLLSVGSNHASPAQTFELWAVSVIGLAFLGIGLMMIVFGRYYWTWTAGMFSFGYIALHGFQMLKLFVLAAARHREHSPRPKRYPMSGHDHVIVGDNDDFMRAFRHRDRRGTPAY